MELAERLGRSLSELLEGSPGHTPLSSVEFSEWMALERLRIHEAKQARARKR